jgi:transposase
MKSYSLDLRRRLVAGRRRGQSAEELARLFGVSKRSVERFWKRHVEEGTLEPKARGGYRRSRLEGHDELLRQWITQQPDLSMEEMRERFDRQLDIRIGTTALWHRLDKLGLSYKKNAARRRARAA